MKMDLWGSFVLTGGGVCIVYVLLPFIVRLYPWIAHKIVFLHFVEHPKVVFKDLKKPESFGLKKTRNFYLDVDEESTIGVWHTLPNDAGDQIDNNDECWEKKLQEGQPIILYLHGNSSSRAQPHRVELMKLLAKLNYHVLALDYRGFGDSTGFPSEDGCVADAYFLYNWIRKRSADVPVIIWGHSLGTGIGTKLTKQLCDKGEPPDGLILQAPFTNLKHVSKLHPFSALFRFLPWFDWAVLSALDRIGLHFKSDENIASVTVPILLLHAEDDFTIPHELGELLHEEAKRVRETTSGHIHFVSFDKKYKYGHNGLYRSPELPQHIINFVASLKR